MSVLARPDKALILERAGASMAAGRTAGILPQKSNIRCLRGHGRQQNKQNVAEQNAICNYPLSAGFRGNLLTLLVRAAPKFRPGTHARVLVDHSLSQCNHFSINCTRFGLDAFHWSP